MDPFLSPLWILHHQKESSLVSLDIQVIVSDKVGKFLPYFKEELSPSGKCENENIGNHRNSPWPWINRQPQPIHANQLDNLSNELKVKSVSLHNHTSDMRPPASVALYSNIKLVPQPAPNSTSSYSHKAGIQISDNIFFDSPDWHTRWPHGEVCTYFKGRIWLLSSKLLFICLMPSNGQCCWVRRAPLPGLCAFSLPHLLHPCSLLSFFPSISSCFCISFSVIAANSH